jgi:hypothetical protein
MTGYNYEIERTFAKYGGEADKGVERTCWNCISYDDKLMMCKHASGWHDTSIHNPNESKCYYHRTNTENERLKALFDEDNRQAAIRRITDNRQNGTGDCAGCPYRKMAMEKEAK